MKFGFLPVGHTHEDIDQLFSCVSRRLKHRNALTVQGKYNHNNYLLSSFLHFFSELSHAVQTSFSPQPMVVVLDSVIDAKGWMCEQTPPIHDHLKAHQFKFQCSESGDCRMFYKEWSTDTYWLPQTGLSFLPTNNTIPGQRPLFIRPYYDPENLKKLETTLRKIGAYLNKAGASEWWESWMEEAKKYVKPVEPSEAEGGCMTSYVDNAFNLPLY